MLLDQFKNALIALSPARCLMCNEAADSANLCKVCRDDLPLLESICRYCGQEIADNRNLEFNLSHRTIHSAIHEPICGPCILSPPVWSRLICAHAYQSPINILVQKMKYRGQLAPSRLLAAQLLRQIKRISPTMPDCLIPVPLHWTRLYFRGFNQSHEIARHLSSHLAIPINTKLCQRRRRTLPQTKLNHAKRKSNVSNAFVLRKQVSGLRVAIVDDVITSGATVTSLASVLDKGGCSDLQVWVCARARPVKK